ncbi:MAG: hypothetical protein V3R33_01010 [Anaerolineales bacterium]
MVNSKTRIQQRRQKKKQQKQLVFLIIGGALIIITGTIFGISAWKNQPDLDLVSVSGQPSLEVDQELIDYGDVKFNTSKTFTINLTNVGDEPLILSEEPYIEVREGC